MRMGEHDLHCFNHGDCGAADLLVRKIKELRERIRPFDNGDCEGEQFADALTELLEEVGIDAS